MATQPAHASADTVGMYRDALLVHLWITALASLAGFDVQIAVRDVELVYDVRPHARA